MTDEAQLPEAPDLPMASDGPPPWSPTGIALITILVSVIPGGIVHALNERRLGRADRWRRALYGNLAVGLAALALAFTGETGRLLRFFIGLMMATWFYKSQAAAFAEHLKQGGPKAPFTQPLLITLGFMVLVLCGAAIYLFASGGW